MNSMASRIAPPGLVEVPMKQISYDSPTPRVDCWVYEVWDTKHRLAYAGIADHFERRWGQHRFRVQVTVGCSSSRSRSHK